jgi:hypothetical protein
LAGAAAVTGDPDYISDTSDPNYGKPLWTTGADWFKGIRKLTGGNYAGTIWVEEKGSNTVGQFAYTETTGTPDVNTKWAYFDGSSWDVVTKAAPFAAVSPGKILKIDSTSADPVAKAA